MSMIKAYELWSWIQGVELKFGVNMKPIPDNYVKVLVNRLDDIYPFLTTTDIPKYKHVLNNLFVMKFENKLYTEEKNRSMLFDFIKNMIHEILLDKGFNESMLVDK